MFRNWEKIETKIISNNLSNQDLIISNKYFLSEYVAVRNFGH